ncbi:hypothetical protein JXA12_02510 [Candidatus Woesearchaeota archaeon]|nr:hypothetical protein [Candidatus Woesearchaeota archaeon]
MTMNKRAQKSFLVAAIIGFATLFILFHIFFGKGGLLNKAGDLTPVEAVLNLVVKDNPRHTTPGGDLKEANAVFNELVDAYEGHSKATSDACFEFLPLYLDYDSLDTYIIHVKKEGQDTKLTLIKSVADARTLIEGNLKGTTPQPSPSTLAVVKDVQPCLVGADKNSGMNFEKNWLWPTNTGKPSNLLLDYVSKDEYYLTSDTIYYKEGNTVVEGPWRLPRKASQQDLGRAVYKHGKNACLILTKRVIGGKCKASNEGPLTADCYQESTSAPSFVKYEGHYPTGTSCGTSPQGQNTQVIP